MVAEEAKTTLTFKDRKWFVDRIGSRVFREDNGCGCETCARISRFGLVIKSEQHAGYLYEVQGEMSIKYYEK